MVILLSNIYGGIGEVVNTPDCGSGMHGFDPHISPHIKIYVHLVRYYYLELIIFCYYEFFCLIKKESRYNN